MRRLSLSTILIAINVGVLLLAIAGVAIAAVQLLQGLADDQALARVAQATVIARQEIDNEHNEVLRSAQLLAERPTLRRLLDEQNTSALTTFLEQFQQTSQLDGTAVWRDGAIVASSGTAINWDVVWDAREPQEPRLLTQENAVQPLIMAAWSSLPDQPNALVFVAQ